MAERNRVALTGAETLEIRRLRRQRMAANDIADRLHQARGDAARLLGTQAAVRREIAGYPRRLRFAIDAELTPRLTEYW